MRVPGLAWRQLRRDLAAGEIRILLAALLLAVMAVSAVGFLTDRVERALTLDANRLLGGDAVLRADEPIPQALRALADRPGLKHAETHSFPSMIRVGENPRFGDVKAISDAFPLRGSFQIQTTSTSATIIAKSIPQPGTVWMSKDGAQTLSAKIGDAVFVGDAKLILAALVVQEPDAGLDFFGAGPKVFLNLADLPATGLEQEGSRITYRLVVAGDPTAVENFVSAVRPRLGRGERLETAADARPEIRSALDRAGRFLGLAALVSVVLAAIAVAMAARRHSTRHTQASAVMRCLGASQRTLVGVHAGELLMLGVIASGLGIALAWGLQFGLGSWLAQSLGLAIPAAGWRPVFEGFGVGLTVLLAFGIPPVLALRRVPALLVLRRDVDIAEPSAWLAALLGLSGLALLLWWKAGSAELGTAMLIGIVATLAVLALLAFALIAVVRRLRTRLHGPWRYGLANVSRRAGASVAQISSLGLGLMVLLLLTFVRSDLLARWQHSLPADAPNRFVINVQPEQVAAVSEYLSAAGVKNPTLYPMVRGRLIEVNGKPITGTDYAAMGERAQHMAEREFNLSSVSTLRPDNTVIAGKFWPATGAAAPELSVEKDIADTLGWKLGDRIAFNIGGQRYQARISSLRKVEWESFQPNFFVVASPGSLNGFSTSYVSAVHAPATNAAFVNGLVERFPNLTVIDVDAILEQVRATMAQVSAVVQAVFYFSLVAGILVLLASVSASQDERLLEGAIMRVLGANRRQLLLAQASEFAVIGLLSGLTAAIAATVTSGVIAQRVFDLPWSADPGLVATSAAIGMAAAMITGMLATRRVLDAPPAVSLRELQV
jgi:putative ABC transport system permease protein